MADINFTWRGPQAIALVHGELKKRLYKSVVLVANDAKISLSEAYPPASSPGEPPHRRTGRLRASVAFEVDGFVGRVGTNVHYGRILELNRGRPWLRPALMRNYPKIQAILGSPIV
jgi:hypothetical protein